ncbi:MAG: hypothetical protein Q9210_002922 [Variospora velana]
MVRKRRVLSGTRTASSISQIRITFTLSGRSTIRHRSSTPSPHGFARCTHLVGEHPYAIIVNPQAKTLSANAVSLVTPGQSEIHVTLRAKDKTQTIAAGLID